ncbi:MAG: endonuclease, partial [Alistipes sp.]|nr:endonuclease [Alistipes sp.]
MKKLILFLVCVAVAFGATSCAGNKNEIKVISYNIRLSGGDGENHWDKRKHASINMIKEEMPTVFGVQEAKPDQMEYLVENLPDYGHIGVGRDDGKQKGEHMTIFWLKDEVEMVDGGT